MMQIEACNPIVKNALITALSNENEDEFRCCDYDNCSYLIQRKNDQNTVFFNFKCYNYREIAEAGGNYFLERWYKDYKVVTDSEYQGYDLTLAINVQNLLEDLKKVPKNSTPEKEEEIKEQNRQIKESNFKKVQHIAETFAKFRRNFYGSAIERALTAIESGQEVKNTHYSTREQERIWLVTTTEQKTKEKCLSVYYGVSFNDIVDKTIAKLILDEMDEAKRHIKNPPAVVRSMDQDKLPEPLIEAFPEFKKSTLRYNNGLICISLFQKQHINNFTEKLTTYLQGFRQYLHYHIHAQKSYLHSRTIKRINEFQKTLNQAKFQKDEDKYFRTLKEQNQLVPAIKDEDPLQKQILKGEGPKLSNVNPEFK